MLPRRWTKKTFITLAEVSEKWTGTPTGGESAADVLKQAMIDVHAALPGLAGGRARMILTVHDELVFEVPEEELAPATELVERAMTGVCEMKVPLEVDVSSGANWAEAKG